MKIRHKLILVLTGLISAAVILLGCIIMNNQTYDIELESSQIREKTEPLNTAEANHYPEIVASYFEYYGLNFGDEKKEHIFGTFDSNGFTIAAHIYKPVKYKATVIILHGYLNHCGQLKNVISFLLENGYAVAAYDMPGHGLSTGDKAAIDDFSQYSDVLSDFTEIITGRLNGPYHLIGFSNGGATALNYLFTADGDIFDKVILAAPLVHSYAWEESKAGLKLYEPFAEFVPRLNKKNSSDPEFIEFNRKKDYLHANQVPVKWVKALHKWNKRIEDIQTKNRTLKIIQGTEDTTVDYEYNINFIKENFSDVKVEMIQNARHELFNESVELRKEVFTGIIKYIENDQ
jgi:alpha-beta hydrolase superfamily lysophospholipase